MEVVVLVVVVVVVVVVLVVVVVDVVVVVVVRPTPPWPPLPPAPPTLVCVPCPPVLLNTCETSTVHPDTIDRALHASAGTSATRTKERARSEAAASILMTRYSSQSSVPLRQFPKDPAVIARCGTIALATAMLCCGMRSGAPGGVATATVTTSAAPPAAVVVATSGVPEAAPGPPPACEEAAAEVGPWGRAEAGEAGMVTTVAGANGALGGLAQTIAGKGTARLRFFGTHVFDVLDKLDSEGGASEGERRKLACAVLDEAAKNAAPVLRIWGSLKRTGSTAELERARDMLALLLDENARRARPLRFMVSLLNHQPGYGLPDPEASLDDQKAPGWSAREVYLEGAWQRRGIGQLAERIAIYRDEPKIRTSPYIVAWELVNELDTHRSVAHGSFLGPSAAKLRSSFLVPAATLLAESFPQPLALGDLRGGLAAYRPFAAGVLDELPPAVRARLIWTAHVYVEHTHPPPSASEARAFVEKATRKLDVDLEIARKAGLPFVLGEIGQLVRGAKTAYCKGGATHDIAGLLASVLSPDPDPQGRREIEAALFWGEGMCGLVAFAPTGRPIDVGAGGDSADLGPHEAAARAALGDARRSARFVLR